MSNYLITGYWGEPHVTAENDRGINAAIFGTGRFVLPVGEQFRAEYIGNNTVRMYDGKLLDNGAAAGIPAGKYVDLLIPEAGQGMKRNDLVVFQYEQDASTLIESGRFVVISGAETSGTATDPELTQQDLMTDKASFDQMAMWRVSVSGASISAPVKLFEVYSNEVTADNIKGTLPLSKGGTGATTAVQALKNFGITASATELNHMSGVTSGVQGQLNSKLDASNVVNNLTTTTEGYALDARQGKALSDLISTISTGTLSTSGQSGIDSASITIKKVGKMVQVSGEIKIKYRGSDQGNTTVCAGTIPSGYRPLAESYLAGRSVVDGSDYSSVHVRVGTDGKIYCTSVTTGKSPYVYFQGIYLIS